MSKGYRTLHPGMGQAVAERTILRKKQDGSWETWGDVAARVSLGNVSLVERETSREDLSKEYENLRDHIANARILMSGRHLQHGDITQPTRNLEVFSNCSTSAFSWLSFYLLLNGSGVGRCYDDNLMLVDWSKKAPVLLCCLSEDHPDYTPDVNSRKTILAWDIRGNAEILEVEDSREGWAKALERWETLAWSNPTKVKYLVLDFSKVRAKGQPIAGMQNRPASGPIPTMEAFQKANRVRYSDAENWEKTMRIDHAFAECVVVGGARRAARIAIKHWKDPGIFRFIEIKSPKANPDGNVMWSANNSVGVDAEFWESLEKGDQHAVEVFQSLTRHSYFDGTGEPGLINLDKLTQKDEGRETVQSIGSEKYQPYEESQALFKVFVNQSVNSSKSSMICNPCGEITISSFGGYCIIGDLAPYHADSLEDVVDSAKAITRAVMRVNLMGSIYSQEVNRTNRIGVGLTGVHEFAWKFFGVGFRELINPEDYSNARAFWKFLDLLGATVQLEATAYSKILGLPAPHTALTVKPSGTVSKLFGLTEGWHLPAMEYYLRWVQFRSDDPLVTQYSGRGYPTKELKTYSGTTVIGFPTQTEIAKLNLGDKLVTAGQATPEEQYKWLQLGEKYWLGGTMDNQISYTLKYDPKKVNYHQFAEMLRVYQSQVKCCSVMPQEDTSAYEYMPEEPISKETYEEMLANIKEPMVEDIGKEHLDCGSGGCPIDFTEGKK